MQKPVARKYPLTQEAKAILREHYKPRTPGAIRTCVEKLGWSREAVVRAAKKLGLTRETRIRWTPEQDAFLMMHAGERTAVWIEGQMRRRGLGCRSVGAIKTRFKELEISYRVTNGYTMKEIAECFGVCDELVRKWVAKGLLQTKWQPRDERDRVRFTDAAIREFVKNHPQEYSLARVDQLWFLGLVFPKVAKA